MDAAPPKSVGFGSVLRNRSYLLYLAVANAGAVGYSVYVISILWLSYQISGNLVIAGLVLFIETAAYSATFLVGPLIDRVRDKRNVFLICYPIQAATAAVLGLGIERGFLTIPLLLGLVALISVLWDFTWAAGNVIPGILLTPDEQFAASGVSGAIGGGNSIAGYAVGGVLILVVGPAGGQFLYAGLLLAGALLAVGWSVPSKRRGSDSFGESFGEGWRLILGGQTRPLLQFAVVDALRGFFGVAPPLLITLLANTVFPNHVEDYGVLFTVYIVGGIAAGLLAGRWNPRRRVGAILVGSLFAMALTVAVAVRAAPFLLGSALAWGAVGFAIDAYLVAEYVYLRGAYPAETLGRLTSNLYLFPGVASALGALAVGFLASSVAPIPLGYLTALGFAAAGLLALALPAVKRFAF